MPQWVITLLAAAIGFAAGIVPVQLNIQNEKRKRSQDAVKQLLSRIFAVSDSIQYSLNAAKREDTESIEKAVWSSGELPGEVGQSLVLLPKNARPHAQDVSDTLRFAGISLGSYRKAPDRIEFLEQADEAYKRSRDALRKLGEALDTQG
jgi:hypothetical protein